MAFADFIPFYNPDPFEDLVTGLDAALGDADVLALLPYDDGTFYIKRAYFDKYLIGGIGGYETDDGDKITVDGTGEAVRELFGIPILLAVDPTEHAAAVDPIKALIAHKNHIGEWVRVDRRGTVIQVGPAINPAPLLDAVETADEAYKQATADELLTIHVDNYDPREWSHDEKEDYIAEHEEGIKDVLADALAEGPQAEVSADGVVGDGGMVGDLVDESKADPTRPTLSFEDALIELSESGDVTKIYDIAPPAGFYQNGDGDVKIEEATHIAVDQSKAADLLPTTWDTVEINTALDRARMEEYEEGKLMKYFTYGMIAGGVGGLVFTIVLFLMFQIGGGVF